MAVVRSFTDAEAKPVLDGVSMRMVIGPDQGAPVFNMRIFDVQPGAATPFHQHWWEHEVFVLEGTANLKLHDKLVPLKSGSAVLVGRNEMHQFVNSGNTLFRFMCLVPQEWLENLRSSQNTDLCCG
jgi:quercetin dioxygenase-like cupin family protein